MIIDSHGHYTTAPVQHEAWRRSQLAGEDVPTGGAKITDDEIRESLEAVQLRLQRERGIDRTLFSPRAGGMAHHVGTFQQNLGWAQACNDLIHRACGLYPDNFSPVAQMPQAPRTDPKALIPELRRVVEELGFVGCNLNPDPSGGYWTGAPMTDESWFPVYQALSDLNVPAMVHVSQSCNPNFHFTGAHYLNADTSVFMQLLQSDLFVRFPKLRLVIPHGGGAVPFHWGRYQGMAIDQGWSSPADLMGENLFFDTCVYHQGGIDLLVDVIPSKNVLFASEMHGAVRCVNPVTGHAFDDTRRYIEQSTRLDEPTKQAIYWRNAARVYPRLGLF